MVDETGLDETKLDETRSRRNRCRRNRTTPNIVPKRLSPMVVHVNKPTCVLDALALIMEGVGSEK